MVKIKIRNWFVRKDGYANRCRYYFGHLFEAAPRSPQLDNCNRWAKFLLRRVRIETFVGSVGEVGKFKNYNPNPLLPAVVRPLR